MLKSLQRIMLSLAMAVTLPVMAQSDPPARVGRLAHIENQVDFRVDRNEQAAPATLNWPVSSGAVLETGQRGRAEVWIGSTAYRLGDDSQIEFSVVDDARVDVRLNGGSLAISVLDRDQVNDLVVTTPDGYVRFQTPGRYRVDVYADHSELRVQAGRATFDGGQRAIPVAAGQKASRWSDGNDQMDADRTNDTFDRWVANRENITLASQSRRYVSPGMTGYQDLDAYGDWQAAPDYGTVWYPRAVADDWAPYRYGRWAWVEPWGWTWIDQAPWGFAPFHYGRWAIIQGRWGWVPGSIVSRPVYAPALVAWIGNPGWSVGFRSGTAPAVGWFPLAPREVYVPGHRYSANYIRQINVANVRDVKVIDRVGRGGAREAFAYNGVPRAVTVVPANMVREGHSITAREVQHQERSELGRAPFAGRAPNAEWLAPAQGAGHSRNDERRDAPSFQRRDFDASRQNSPERGLPRSETLQRTPDRPAFRQPPPEAGGARDGEVRRDAWRGAPEVRQGVENKGRPVEVVPAPVVPQRHDAPSAVQPVPDAGRVRPADAATIQRQDNFRRPDAEMRARPPESAPAPMRRDMPVPEVRTEERQPRPMVPPQEREPRREMQDVQRMERQAPPLVREMPPQRAEPPRPTVQEFRAPAPAPMPQQRAEPPRPAVQEFRAPAPAPMPQQRAEPPRPPVQEFRAPPPPPAPAAMPQPRVEPPRQPAPQGGGQQDQHRRRGNEEERPGR
jgi:hypothetical protein